MGIRLTRAALVGQVERQVMRITKLEQELRDATAERDQLRRHDAELRRHVAELERQFERLANIDAWTREFKTDRHRAARRSRDLAPQGMMLSGRDEEERR